MCGIAGAVALTLDARPDVARVRAMSCQIAHRGPDGEGIWIAPSGRACLAHRRLSIIDLSTGQQPMTDEGERFGLVFNGEIYNYCELRDELRAQGATFRTQSDTEVLLRLLARDGVHAIAPLRGMFAFALWDEATSTLTMARDRLGKKPLYYTVHDGSLYFASSLIALRETSPSRWSIDVRAADLFLGLGYVPAPTTIYQGVYKLPAATTLVVRDGELRSTRFWDLAHADAPFEGSFDAAVDQLDGLLETAVSQRLRSDVPLGVFLSGGIDSSLVTAFAARLSPNAVRTFSIGFDDAGFDESGYAARVAHHLGTEHQLFRVRTELLELLPRVVHDFGEPYADSSAMPTWVLADRTRQHVTVALGGDGGDEGFAGYAWYGSAARLARLSRRVPAFAAAAGEWALGAYRSPAAPGARRIGQLRRGLGVMAFRDEADRFASLRTFVGRDDAALLYAGPLAESRRAGDPARALVADAYRRCEGSPLRRMRYADLSTYLADDLLPKVDVATMAHGLEARAPLLDHEVVRFALSLPDEYLTDERGGKRPLRALLHRHLPSELFERPKQGFSVPLPRWFAGDMRSRVDGLAHSERFRELGWFRPAGLVRLVDEHAAGLRENSQRLFSLLMLDEWLKAQ